MVDFSWPWVRVESRLSAGQSLGRTRTGGKGSAMVELSFAGCANAFRTLMKDENRESEVNIPIARPVVLYVKFGSRKVEVRKLR
jgi:hypothetical protein